MNDATLIRLTTETVRHLKDAISVSPAFQLVPSYNAVLSAAQANHPNDPFLGKLKELPASGDEMISIAEMTALFAQIGIALESLSENG